MVVYVVVDYHETNNSVAYDRHVYENSDAAQEAAKQFDTRTSPGIALVEEWDTELDGPVMAPGQVYHH